MCHSIQSPIFFQVLWNYVAENDRYFQYNSSWYIVNKLILTISSLKYRFNNESSACVKVSIFQTKLLHWKWFWIISTRKNIHWNNTEYNHFRSFSHCTSYPASTYFWRYIRFWRVQELHPKWFKIWQVKTSICVGTFNTNFSKEIILIVA